MWGMPESEQRRHMAEMLYELEAGGLQGAGLAV